MRFLIQREKLMVPLQHIIGIVEKRLTMPILANVKLEFHENILTLIATDLEIELCEKITIEQSGENGAITVPAKKFLDIVRSLPEEQMVELETDNQKLLIQCHRARFTLQTLPANEYPNIQYAQNEHEFSIEQKQFKHLIERVYFSMAHQDVRYYLNGMLLEYNNSVLKTVATDGHRLAICSFETQDIAKFYQCIIPRKAVMELIKLLSEDDEIINVSLGSNHLKVIMRDISFTTKLIDAKFPNYETVLPKAGDKSVELNVEEFKKILQRISILTHEKYHGIKLSLRTNKLILQARNNEQEEALDEISIEYQGENLDIGFNVTYFIDVLNNLPKETIKITFSDDNSSALIENKNDQDSLYVIMPMRL